MSVENGFLVLATLICGALLFIVFYMVFDLAGWKAEEDAGSYDEYDLGSSGDPGPGAD